MRPGKYTLVGQTPVRCDDLLEWTHWFEHAERRVKMSRVGPYTVSTVFLGLDHNWGDGPPILFETMIFIHGELAIDGLPPSLSYQKRYATWMEAERGHERAIEGIRELWDEVEQLYPDPLALSPPPVEPPGGRRE